MNIVPNRLVTFGDSWTAGHGIETDLQYKEVIDCGEFINKLRNSNGWPRHLANLYDIPFVNLGWPNLSNPEIVNTVEKNLKNLKKSDLIVVMWSFPYRGDGIPEVDIFNLHDLLDGYNWFMCNSFYSMFEPEQPGKFLDHSRFLDRNLVFSKILLQYEKQNNVSVWEYDFRYPDTWQNTEGGDTHPNYLGYKIIAQQLKQLIDDYYTSSST